MSRDNIDRLASAMSNQSPTWQFDYANENELIQYALNARHDQPQAYCRLQRSVASRLFEVCRAAVAASLLEPIGDF